MHSGSTLGFDQLQRRMVAMPTNVSPIHTYAIFALTSAGTQVNTLVDLSEEQEATHGGISGAARDGAFLLRSLGWEGLQCVHAVPLQTQDDVDDLLAYWETMDEIDLEQYHHHISSAEAPPFRTGRKRCSVWGCRLMSLVGDQSP